MTEDITEVRRNELDEPQQTYMFAGGLIGSEWKFPDGYIATVTAVVQGTEKEQGTKLPFPELRFDNAPRLPASGFYYRINPDVGEDIKPMGDLAGKIVEEIQNDE